MYRPLNLTVSKGCLCAVKSELLWLLNAHSYTCLLNSRSHTHCIATKPVVHLGQPQQQPWWAWRSGTSLKQKSKHHAPVSAGETKQTNFYPQAQPPPHPPTHRLPAEENRVPSNLLAEQSRGTHNPITATRSRPDTSPVHPLLLLYCIKSWLPHSHPQCDPTTTTPPGFMVPSCLSPSNSGHFVKIQQRKETDN